MKTLKNLLISLLLCNLLLLNLNSCTTVEILPDELPDGIEITNTGSYVINTDNGERGLIIDTRQMSHQGYSAQTAEISFPNYNRFDTTLEIEENINIAVFNFANDSLSQEEQAAFSEGIMTLIEIHGEEGVLGTFEGTVVVDDSNIPLNIDTNLDFIPSPVVLTSEVKQLIIFKSQWGTIDTPLDGVTTIQPNTGANPWGGTNDFDTSIEPYNLDTVLLQGFLFEQIDGNRYRIKVPEICEDVNGQLEDCTGLDWANLEWSLISRGGYIKIEDDYNVVYGDLDDPSSASIFELVPKENGWMEMNYVDDDSNIIPWSYYHNGEFGFQPATDGYIAQIRLIPDNIIYSIEDIGTTFLQPIIPPAILDFAYISTIRNCSNAIFNESVGRVESKTRTTSVSATERFKLFTKHEASANITLGFKATIKAGGTETTGGIGAEFEVSGSRSLSYTYTTSQTASTENTIINSFEDQIEVSRVRTITVPAYTGVEVFDYIESADNVKVPFVKKFRISGINEANNLSLSGLELLTVMKGNLFGGLITNVEDESIVISLRGNSHVNSVFVASSGANDIENPCED